MISQKRVCYRNNIVRALQETRVALRVAYDNGWRMDCLRVAERALAGALRNVEYEDAVATAPRPGTIAAHRAEKSTPEGRARLGLRPYTCSACGVNGHDRRVCKQAPATK